jgi:ribosomal protein S18 acetylase RimI-like enzyme
LSSFALSQLENFIDQAAARRLELNEMLPPRDYVQQVQRLHPDLGFEWREIAGGMMFYGGPSCPLNQAVGMGLNGPVTPTEFDEFESFYRDRQTPAQIVVAPFVDPSLMKLLGEGSYRISEFNSVLVCRLADLEPRPLPEHIRIDRVTPETAHRWAEVLCEGFAEFGSFPTSLFEPYGLLPHGLNYLGSIDGEPAGGAAGAMYSEPRLAAIFGAATLPKFRNRGVQTALTQTRLLAARDAGCEIAMVCTQPGSGSQRNAERNGFRVAYTKVVMIRDW